MRGAPGDFAFRAWVLKQPGDVTLFPNTARQNCVYAAGGFGPFWNDMWCRSSVGPINYNSYINDFRGVCESDPINQAVPCPPNS